MMLYVTDKWNGSMFLDGCKIACRLLTSEEVFDLLLTVDTMLVAIQDRRTALMGSHNLGTDLSSGKDDSRVVIIRGSMTPILEEEDTVLLLIRQGMDLEYRHIGVVGFFEEEPPTQRTLWGADLQVAS